MGRRKKSIRFKRQASSYCVIKNKWKKKMTLSLTICQSCFGFFSKFRIAQFCPFCGRRPNQDRQNKFILSAYKIIIKKYFDLEYKLWSKEFFFNFSKLSFFITVGNQPLRIKQIFEKLCDCSESLDNILTSNWNAITN